MQDWEVIGDREVFSNQILRLHIERIRLGGDRETDWSVVDVGDGAAVMPIADDGRIVMIRQHRQAVGYPIWEFPAGRVDAGETPKAAALRELREEAGLDASSLRSLGFVWPLVGIVRHRVHLFAAWTLESVPTALEPFEDIDVRTFEMKEVEQMALEGEIEDALTLSLLLRWKLGGGSRP
ncbi:MAG: NUDIX hydrolase [Planctomycetota bacterium]